MELSVILSFILSLSIGTIIGLEREIVNQKGNAKHFAGIRTFILFSILGFLTSYMSIRIFNSVFAFIVCFAVFTLMIISSYVVMGLKTKRYGATTEIASLLTFLLSAFIVIGGPDFQLIVVIIAIVVASLLATKEHLHNFAKNIKTNEIFAAIKMAVISIIILPFLPNKNYSILDIPYLKEIFLVFPAKFVSLLSQLDVFNPFKIWLMVVFISGLSFVGYILIRTVGTNRGLGITSFLGGMVSSTAVSVSLAERSKKSKVIFPFVIGLVLASSVMFIRVLIEISAVNTGLLKFVVIPIGLMAVFGFLITFWLYKFSDERAEQKLSLKSPFAIVPALKFGLFFAFILLASKLLFILLGDKGIYIAAVISGLADVDAITLSLASMALTGSLGIKTAVLGITIAVGVNTLVKAGIVYFMGSRKVAKKMLIIVLILLAIGLLGAFLIPPQI